MDKTLLCPDLGAVSIRAFLPRPGSLGFKEPYPSPLIKEEVDSVGDHRRLPLSSATGILRRAGLAPCSHTQRSTTPESWSRLQSGPDFVSSQYKSCTHSSLLAKWVTVLPGEATVILSHNRLGRPVCGKDSLKGKVIFQHNQRHPGDILLVSSGFPRLQDVYLQASCHLTKSNANHKWRRCLGIIMIQNFSRY